MSELAVTFAALAGFIIPLYLILERRWIWRRPLVAEGPSTKGAKGDRSLDLARGDQYAMGDTTTQR